MKIESSLLHAYLQGEPMELTGAYPFVKDFHTPYARRKDVCAELLSQLTDMTEEFPFFNSELWNALFSNAESLLDTITIVPIVGSFPPQSYVTKQESQYYIVIDLIHVADFTPIVSQMVYILHNYLTLEITKLCIHAQFPLTSHHYHDILDHMTFAHGLANWLAWNENCKQYKFQSDRYEERKEQAFSMLLQAAQITNKATQHKALHAAVSSDFWKQFPAVAGMFYFDDIYHDVGKDGILLVYRHGPKQFVHTIFHS